MKKLLYFLSINIVLLSSCSINKQISKQAKQTIFSDSNFSPAHVGISIYDPSTNQYLYNYQGDKYFVPASNMKLFTCYAAMKYLGDSLIGLRYQYEDGHNAMLTSATGDPTLLHPDFKNQPVLEFLRKNASVILINYSTHFNPLGLGWAWDDYNEDYMVERSSFPIYGNTLLIARKPISSNLDDVGKTVFDSSTFYIQPSYFSNIKQEQRPFKILGIIRDLGTNSFTIGTLKEFKSVRIPFKTGSSDTTIAILSSILKKPVSYAAYRSYAPKKLYSQPTDSLLKPMMHRSDNFFAEQTLLMVSNETLGYMSDTKIIDSLLQTDFKSLPQKPKWVDGSGLSRYNLITPQDFVWVLNQMKNEFKWERITAILPTGNEGTLAGYYKNYAGKIYAKTGTLSNNVSLSGYITTKKGKQLIFSILVNNHQTSASNIRRTVEKFLTSIMDAN